MAQGDKVCEHAVTALEREERSRRPEPGPGSGTVGDSPGVGIEGILAEGSLRGTHECVEERASSGPEDQDRARQGEEWLQAKGRRDERIVFACPENAERVEARRVKKCAKRLCDRIRSLHACALESSLLRELERGSG
jgi:hypothetical protein